MPKDGRRDAAGTAPCMSTACKHREFKGRVTQAAMADTVVQEEGRNGDTPSGFLQAMWPLPAPTAARPDKERPRGEERECTPFFFPGHTTVVLSLELSYSMCMQMVGYSRTI